MSKEAVKWAMDDAPMLFTDAGKPDTTSRHVLQVLAEHAHKDGGGARPSLMRIQYRTGYDRRTVQRALRRLEDAGLIQAEGTVNGCTEFRLALKLIRPASDMAALEAEDEERRKATAERVRRHRAKDVTHFNDVTDLGSVTHSDAVTEGDVTHFNDVRNAFEVRSVTHSTPPEPTTYEPTTEPTTYAAPLALFGEPPAAAAPAVAKASTRTRPTGDDDFDEFWARYPLKVVKTKARKSYTAAIKRGAGAAQISESLDKHLAYWAFRKTTLQFIPYPTTWLNEERYDDELPNLAAAGDPGGHQPYRQPAPEARTNDKGF